MATTPQHPALPILQNVTIFAGIDKDKLVKIVDRCTTINVARDEVVLREGDPATDILIVLSGRVKIVLNVDREPFEICMFGPGDCLGEVSVIGVLDHSASVVTIEPCTFLILSRETLMNVFSEDKALFSLLILNLARELARRLHRTDEILLQYTHHDQPD